MRRTGGITVTVTFGHQRRRTCLRDRREKTVRSSPSILTGTTIAPDLSAMSPAPS